MADSDKNIRITTNKNKATVLPNIVFTGASAGTSVLTLEVRDDNTVAFTGIDGDVFSLDYNLSTGTIWSVNDKSGTPFLRASAGGTIGIAELGANVRVGIGQANPQYKLDVQGWVGFASTGDGSYTVLLENGLSTGNNALSIRAANALRFYNSSNTLYTGIVGAQTGVNTTYTLPPTSPSSIGASFLTSTQAGVLAWIAPPAGGTGSGTVNSGTATYAAFYANTGTAVDQNVNLQFTGTGLSVGGNVQSSSTTTGSLQVRGGFAATGNAFIGGTTVITNATSSTSTVSGALSVTGGLGLAGNAFIGGTVNITNSAVSIGTNYGALVVAGGVGIGGSLYTSAGSTSSVSGVLLQNGNVSASSYNKLTLTAPAASATLTLANNSTLATTGANSLTLATTNTTSLTLPTAGTLTSTGNNLGVFASTTSAQLINIISDATGTAGKLVFSTSPTFTTSVATDSASFNVFNATATTVNAFQAGTAISLGAATGTLTLNNATTLHNQVTPSTTATTGAIVVNGGVGIGLSVSVGGRLQMFNGANYTAFVSAASGNVTYTLPPTVPSGTGTSYLSSSTTGVMAWVAAPTSSGGSPGGSTGQVQYNNGGAFDGIPGLVYSNPGSGTNFVVNTPGDTLGGTFGILNIGPRPFDGTSLGQFAGSILGTVIAVNAATGFSGNYVNFQNNGVSGFAVSSNGRITIGNNVWSLPTTSGNSGQVLTSNGNGTQASWTTVSSTGAGSGTVAIPGAQYQVAAYYWSATGASVSGSTTFTNNTSTGVVDINHTTESTSTSTGALVVDGGAGIAKSLFVGTALAVGGAPGYNIPNLLGSFVSTVDSYNQLVIQNRSTGTNASANLVVNNNSSTDLTFYGELGMNSSNFSGSGALAAPNAVYVAATSAPLVLGTTTANPIRFTVNGGATDVLYISESGTAISCFVNFGLRSAADLRFWNTGNTQYAGLQGGNTSASYLMTLPTAQVGAGASAIITASDGQMYFVAPGAGIAFSAATANTPTLRAKRAITMQFCAGYTPTAAGPDVVVLKIPESASDGITDITYRLRELDIRVETPSAGSSRIQLEKYVGTTAFTLSATGSSMIAGLGITLSGAGIYFTSTSSFLAGSLVTSNDKLRIDWTLLNATHANFSIQLTMEEV